MLCAARTAAAGGTVRRGARPLLGCRRLSSQHQEGVEQATTSRRTPRHTPDAGDDAQASTGRSSELASTRVADEPLQRLAGRVLSLYDARSARQQRAAIGELYDERAVYENPVTLLRGRDAVAERFALLPLVTSRVDVEFGPAVQLGAATSA